MALEDTSVKDRHAREPSSQAEGQPEGNVDHKTDSDEDADAAKSRQEWDDMFESYTRVSMATFGGCLAGWGIGAKKHAQKLSSRPLEASSAAPTMKKGSLGRGSAGTRTRPPNVPASVASPRLVMARSWGIACCLFSLTLEVTRLISPANVIVDEWTRSRIKSENETMEASIPNENAQEALDNQLLLQTKVQRKALTSLCDYVLGGSLAGIITSRVWAQRGMPSVPRSLALQGLMAGASLGLAGGIVQAGLDAFSLYNESLEQENEHEHESNRSSS